MNWKEKLHDLEKKKDWNAAIHFLTAFIHDNPDNLDAYLFLHFLLVNLIIEEDYDNSRCNEYIELLQNSFRFSYVKFHRDPRYLFYTAKTAYIAEWLFDISIEEVDRMAELSRELDPHNLVYQWPLYRDENNNPKKSDIATTEYARKIINPNSDIQKELVTMGALGQYLRTIWTQWAEDYLATHT